SFFNATITGNTSGVQASGFATVVLRNTIVGQNGVDCAGGFTAVGDAHNIDSDGSCCLSGTDQSGVNPLLGPLQDNGGPTLTHARLPGSPAINTGSPALPGSGGTACEATDQRG